MRFDFGMDALKSIMSAAEYAIKLNKLSDNYDIHCLLALVFEKDRSAKPYVNWGYL